MPIERRTSSVNRAAVLAALAEYDAVGEDAFLAKYGYGRARTYALWHEGRPYASKAVIGAAFGYLPGRPPPLRLDEFSGGLIHVVPVLEGLGFSFEQPTAPRRNPPWSRDELILALDLYHRHDGRDPGSRHPDVVAASALLREMAGSAGLATYRNPNGVKMKMMNFRSFDPAFTGRGGRGLASAGKLDREVWDEFADKRAALALAAEAIRQGVLTDADDEVIDEAEGYLALEGRVSYRLHRHLERDRKVVLLRKAAALKAHGRLACEACGFDFLASYGPRGSGYLEAHHTNPVHAMQAGQTTRPADLALLCANCHRMVHASKPWLGVPELKELVGRP